MKMAQHRQHIPTRPSKQRHQRPEAIGYYSSKRISPLDDEFGVFSDEVLVAEDEQGARVGAGDAGQADVGGSLGDRPQRVLLTAPSARLLADVRVCR